MHRTGRASCEEIVSSETWHPTVCVTTRCDNCVRVPNPGQHDIDKDHIGDVCSRRGPSIPVHSGPQTFMEVEWCFSPPEVRLQACDNCPLVYNPLQTNSVKGSPFGDKYAIDVATGVDL